MSGFTSFLKKFGLDAIKVAENLIGGPKIVIQDMAQAGSDVKALIGLIKSAERMAAAMKLEKSGSQKLAAVMPDAVAIMGDVEVLAGTKLNSIIKDQAEFNGGVQDLMSSLVKILNACGD